MRLHHTWRNVTQPGMRVTGSGMASPIAGRIAEVRYRRASGSKQGQLAAFADRALEQIGAQLRVARVEA